MLRFTTTPSLFNNHPQSILQLTKTRFTTSYDELYGKPNCYL